MNILLIEDDQNISLALMQALRDSYAVDRAETGQIGIDKAAIGSYDMVLLDLGLPDIAGLTVCKELRHSGFSGPIIITSGESKIISKIQLLDAGADDYLTKPFSLGELKARLRALQRRDLAARQAPKDLITVDDLILDRDRHTVEREGRIIRLRRKEFGLLECLMQHAGSVVTREILGNHAWHSNEDPWTNTIDVHIKYLRDKIDRPFTRPLIKTVHGLGYKLEAPQRVASYKLTGGGHHHE